MKCDILCKECMLHRRTLIGKYQGEEIKIVTGKAKQDMFCDGHSSLYPIKIGEECYASSIYTERTPYFEWETKYIDFEIIEI